MFNLKAIPYLLLSKGFNDDHRFPKNQQVSGHRAVHDAAYYSTAVQSDITATQKITIKHDHRRYSTSRYLQAVRSNVQVVVTYNVRNLNGSRTRLRANSRL